ncbi:MAG: sulfatase [Bacteroidota bacterium]
MRSIHYCYLFLLPYILVNCSTNSNDQNATTAGANHPPNIIFILADDHAERAISAYDTSLITTPNLDCIAREGMLFRNSFVTNSICAPARASILTGLYSHLNGKRDNVDTFNGDQATFIKTLRANGYHTSVIGKWHLKSRPQGFDYWQTLIDQGDYYNPTFITNGDTAQAIGYTSTIITDQALAQLEERATADKPFCMLYWHKAPHRNWMPDVQDLEGLLEKKYPEPPTLRDTYAGRAAAEEADMRIADMFVSNDLKVTSDYLAYDDNTGGHADYEPSKAWRENLERFTPEQRAAWAPFLEAVGESYLAAMAEDRELAWRYQRYMQDYLASITSVDRNVGRVLDFLDENGLAENTIVIYSSDQGFYLGEHGWYDKRFMYEESMRTPLMIRYPQMITAGSENNNLVLNVDMAPTLLEMAGLASSDDMQGQSIVPLLQGNTPPDWRDHAYFHYYEYPHGWHSVNKHEGVRGERYKLIRFYTPNSERYELFDLQDDPNELNNRYGDPELVAVTTRLKEELKVQRDKLKVKE